MRRLVPTLVLLLGVLLAAAWWLAGRESTLRWALDRVVAASNGKLAFSGVSGNLLGSVRVAQGRFASPKVEVIGGGLALDFSLPALLQRRLAIDRLEVETLRVVLVPSDEPLELPESLSLPFAVDVARLHVGRLDIQRGDFSLTLRQLGAGFSSSGRAHAFELHSAESPWGSVKGRARLEGMRPFALAGHAEFAPGASQPRLPHLALDAGGSLAQIRAAAGARSAWLQARATGVVRPFEGNPLRDLQASVAKLDLHGLDASLPRAIIAGRLSATQTGETRMAGRLALTNQAPGTLAENLPLTTLDAAFTADPDELVLDGLRLGLRLGAPLTGRARLGHDGVTAQLAASALDLRALHDRLAPTRLSGTLEIRADAEVQRLQAQLADARQSYVIDARRRGDRITLERGSLRSGAGRVELQGELTARAQWPFQARARLVHFDPAAYGDFPSARINANVSGSGRLRPGWQFGFSAEIADSVLAGEPLSGRVQATLAPERISESRGDLAWGRNRAVFQGALGAKGDRLELERVVLDLHSFDARWSGLASGSGSLSGRARQPAVALRMQAADIRGPGGLAVGQAGLVAEVAPELDAPLSLQAQLAHTTLGEFSLERAILTVAGTGRDHQAKLTAGGKNLALEARLAGGFRQQFAWQGQLQQFVLEQPRPFTLEAPASLTASRSGFELGPARLRSDKTLVELDRLVADATGLRSAGRFSGLPAAFLGLPLRRSVRSEALLGGEWQIAAGERVNGHLTVRHESGLWAMEGPVGLAVRPTRGQLDVVARDNRVTVDADVALRDGSTLELELATELSGSGRRWSIPGDAPFRLKAKGSIASLERWGSLLHRDIALAGRLRVDVAADGSWHHPGVSGHIDGEDIDVRHFPSGVSFTDGTLRARLEGEEILIDRFQLKAGEGRLNVDGRARLGEKPDLRLRFKGERLALTERKDLDLDADVNGELSVGRELVALNGRIAVNRGVFVLGDSYAPSLSPDVRIKGRTAKPQATEKELGLALDVTVDLGKDFRVRSSQKGQLLGGKLPFHSGGLDARITGQVRMRGDRGENVSASGEIRVADGSYYVIGQRLDIDRGILRFDGPLLNPALDISAVREKPQMKAGLTITGTAQNPRTRLFSEPEVPDQEKLSWLLFGRGGQPVDSSVGSVGSVTSSAQGVLSSFGFQVSERLYVAYEQSATGTENFVSFYSSLTDRLSIEARAGDENALSLFYTFILGRPEKTREK